MAYSLMHSLADKEEKILLKYAEKEQIKEDKAYSTCTFRAGLIQRTDKDFSMIQCQNNETDILWP